MRIKFKKLREGATPPSHGSKYAAGYDLYACINNDHNCVVVAPHTTEKVGTGLSIQPPNDYFGAIFARSGLATKQGIRPANCVWVCDEDYTGEYIIPIYNDSNEKRIIKNGDRIAQLIFLPYLDVEFIETDNIESTERGDGGFGSTGK